jgi:protein SCO1
MSPLRRAATALLLASAVLIPASAAHAAEATPAAHHHDMAGMVMPPAAGALPGTSLYQLDLALEPASGAPFRLASLAGRPVLVTMFYSHCTSVCPMLTSQLQRLVSSLPQAARERADVLMVSFDSLRDTPPVLAAFASAHHIDGPRWHVARGSAADVRALAAALGIQYRELPDHSFNHSAVIALLDAEGVPRARSEQLAGDDPAFRAAVGRLAAARGR